jgi:hypothetical protein
VTVVRSGPRSGYRWTHQNIVYAIELWHRRHLRAPAVSDWERAGRDHPTRHTVQRVFGSWNSAIRAAGLRPRKPGEARTRWARNRCAVTGKFVAGPPLS